MLYLVQYIKFLVASLRCISCVVSGWVNKTNIHYSYRAAVFGCEELLWVMFTIPVGDSNTQRKASRGHHLFRSISQKKCFKTLVYSQTCWCKRKPEVLMTKAEAWSTVFVIRIVYTFEKRGHCQLALRRFKLSTVPSKSGGFSDLWDVYYIRGVTSISSHLTAEGSMMTVLLKIHYIFTVRSWA